MRMPGMPGVAEEQSAYERPAARRRACRREIERVHRRGAVAQVRPGGAVERPARPRARPGVGERAARATASCRTGARGPSRRASTGRESAAATRRAAAPRGSCSGSASDVARRRRAAGARSRQPRRRRRGRRAPTDRRVEVDRRPLGRVVDARRRRRRACSGCARSGSRRTAQVIPSIGSSSRSGSVALMSPPR